MKPENKNTKDDQTRSASGKDSKFDPKTKQTDVASKPVKKGGKADEDDDDLETGELEDTDDTQDDQEEDDDDTQAEKDGQFKGKKK